MALAMHRFHRLRHPLTWLLLLEVGVVFALLALSWRLYSAHLHPGSSPPPEQAASMPAPAAAPIPGRSLAPGAAAAVAPAAPRTGDRGLPFDVAQLNRDQAALERAQAAAIESLTGALRLYIVRVVLPAVERAERVSTATTPAAAQSPAAIRKMP